MSHRETSNINVLHDEKNSVAMVETDGSNKDASEFEHDAALGNQAEKEMPLGTAFRYYRKAAIWSILICKS